LTRRVICEPVAEARVEPSAAESRRLEARVSVEETPAAPMPAVGVLDVPEPDVPEPGAAAPAAAAKPAAADAPTGAGVPQTSQ
jgi:hypothetical protein